MIAGIRIIELLVASAIVAISATIHGAIGLGMGLVATPFLLLIDPVFAPGPMLFGSLVLTPLMVMREHRDIDLFGLKWALVGRVIGSAIATYLFINLPGNAIIILSACLILLAVGLSISGISLRPTRAMLIGAGTLSGIMGTISSSGGPPIALLYQNEKGPRLRATMSGFFVIATAVSLIALLFAGKFGLHELHVSLILLPSVIVGFFTSKYMLATIDRGYIKLAVLLVSAVSSMILIFKHI